MTLFVPETLEDPSDLAARRTAHLPTPAKTRFEPLRAGVTNVWEYDDQQFWFTDGRLLLRGRNEAGKSKVLELLFPFVLDGDISPKKLDPFDTANKSMWWNMIGYSPDRTSAIGYLWIEFGRLDEAGQPEYLTSIVGVQATRAEKKVATWFAVTPQRIGADLDLAPGDVCRTHDSFRTAMSPDASFTTKSSGHRANVATRLFSMSPERFDNLLHLLRQLRKPKLADKLDAKKLSAVLTDALPPLDENRMKPLADGFSFLDADIAELHRTEVAHRATGAFLEVYRNYAQTHVRERADAVRQAFTRYDNVTRSEVEAEATLKAATSETARLADEATKVGQAYAEASGNLDGLDLSAVESLYSLEQIAARDATLVDAVTGESTRANEAADRADLELTRLTNQTGTDLASLSSAVTAARTAAERAKITTGWEADDHETSAGQLTAAVNTDQALVEAVDEAERRAGTARQQLAIVADRLAQTGGRREDAADHLATAVTGEAEAQDSFVVAVDAWCDNAPAQRPTVDGAGIADDLADKLTGGIQVRSIAVAAAGPARDAAAAAVSAATVADADAQRHLTIAEADLAAHDALPVDPPPPTRPGIAETRAGTPLWLAVEFADHLDATEAAMLEAALDAAGLLDALITKKGLEVLDGDDTLLVTSKAGALGLSGWLKPADGADEVLAARAISAIGAGPDAGTGCWVDVDGAWANGPLTGRWTKTTAEHIGAGARAIARTRRRAELTAELEEANTRCVEAVAALATASAHAITVDDWVDAFPSLSEWTTAVHTLRAAEKAAARADSDHRAADKAHTAEVAKVAGILAAVDVAVEAARCRPEEVATRRGLLNTAADRARSLRSAAVDHKRSVAATEKAAVEAKRVTKIACKVAARLEEARLTATESKAKYDKAVEVSGADVEEILAEKDRLEASVADLRNQGRKVDKAKEDARVAEARAEEVLRQTTGRREEERIRRDAALAGLAAVARTGHVTLALGVDAGRDPSDYLQPTAGRTLARQVAAAVDEALGTEAARTAATNRLTGEYNRLRDDVGADFDPHLDTEDGIFTASATLNGEVIDVAQLHRALAEDADQRRKAIAAGERTLIEQHLRDEVGNHLGERLHDANTQVKAMNETLKRHPTNSGATVALSWKVDNEAGPNVKASVEALLTSPVTRSAQSSAVLATFLAERVSIARRGDIEGADLAERLTAALDYRRWYNFKLRYSTATGAGALTAKTVGAGSGGQQAKVGHLPLLAAAAGFYSSSPTAPRLCVLDEAFAGIDGPNTADLLDFSVSLGLDLVLTNYDAWFCIPQLPGLAIYHLEKLTGTVGVAAIRYTWDGTSRDESDPWLDG